MASQQKLATKDPNKATEAEARQWYANYNKDGKGDVDVNDLIKFHEESYRDEENPEEGLKEGQRQAAGFLVSTGPRRFVCFL